MFEKFVWLLDRYQELSEALSQPDIIADQPKWQALLKEHASLEPSVEAYREYQQIFREEAEAQEMLEVPEMEELAKSELNELRERREQQEHKLKLLLLPKDPDADRNVVVEIRQGAGGDEAALFGALLLRMYTRYAERHRFKVEPVSYNMTELGGVKEAVFTIIGQGAFSRLKYESGVHRVQRVPLTESQGRIQTSTATVAVLPEAEDFVPCTLEAGDGVYGSVSVETVLAGVDGSGETVGYAIGVHNSKSYDGGLTVVVGILPDGTVTGIYFTELHETPGMGMRCGQAEFMDQFKNVSTQSFALRGGSASTEPGIIDGVSATISSSAVVDAVNGALRCFAENLG